MISAATGFQQGLKCQTHIPSQEAGLKSDHTVAGYPPHHHNTIVPVRKFYLAGQFCRMQGSQLGRSIDAAPTACIGPGAALSREEFPI